MKTLALLGSTGSIGQNVCAIVRQFPERFCIRALAAGRNVELLAKQVLEFAPACISVAEEALVPQLSRLLPKAYRGKISWGNEGLCEVAALGEAEMTVGAVVGAAGLKPALAALRAGKTLALANKEPLVMAGELVMREVRRQGLRLFPIDSEHSAIFQALQAGRREDVRRLLLTASGGPFRALSAEALENVGPDAALAHPNWSMGRKITIDSATMMNKGLEVIEARWLFDLPPERIQVVVHPQSIVHSLVEYQDGAQVAQLGIPDMRIPIAYALSYPERLPLELPPLELPRAGTLSFEEPDNERFPALNLAYAALKAGGLYPALLNAANEVAASAFLQGQIRFPQITALVEKTLSCWQEGAGELTWASIMAADNWARAKALELISAFSA